MKQEVYPYEDIGQFPDLYDKIHKGKESAELFARLAGARKRLLEPSVGTGRIAIELARRGFTVVGMDHSERMLSQARKKAQREPVEVQANIELILGDMRDFDLRRSFEMIYVPSSDFLHLLTLKDQISALKCFQAHLEADGLLVIQSFNVWSQPMLDVLLRNDGGRRDMGVRVDEDSGQRFVESWQCTFNSADSVVTCWRHIEIFNKQGTCIQHVLNKSAWLICTITEMKLLLALTGFDLVGIYGDEHLSPFEHNSRMLVLVARPSTAHGRVEEHI